MPHKKTVVIICGPTAVGKTRVAIELAQHYNTQVISADSRQCYKELNIGVAKPSPDELAAVHHYFIDSHSITDEVNAVVFEQYALNAANTIFEHRDIAVMVGGTGLYIKSFCDGLDEMPAIPAEIRAGVILKYESEGLLWLQDEVQKNDAEFWATGETQNPQRLMRALEVKLSTGRSINDFRKGYKSERPFNIIKIGLELPKDLLHKNINTRVEKMMQDGLLKEVKSLLPYKHLNALQTVGYKEPFTFFEGTSTLEEAIERIKINTRQYAKRQMTWFKKDKDVNWHSVGDHVVNDVVSQINSQIN